MRPGFPSDCDAIASSKILRSSDRETLEKLRCDLYEFQSESKLCRSLDETLILSESLETRIRNVGQHRDVPTIQPCLQGSWWEAGGLDSRVQEWAQRFGPMPELLATSLVNMVNAVFPLEESPTLMAKTLGILIHTPQMPSSRRVMRRWLKALYSYIHCKEMPGDSHANKS